MKNDLNTAYEVQRAAKLCRSGHGPLHRHEDLEFLFEGGEWSARCRKCGGRWRVVEDDGGYRGFNFQPLAKGSGACLPLKDRPTTSAW